MGAQTTQSHVKYIFNGEDRVIPDNSDLAGVYKKVQEYVRYLNIFGWVKYIAITGSYAAEKSRPEDDIDLFIVIENGRLWWYRGLLTIHPALRRVMRRDNHSSDNAGKLCINLIAQERGVSFDPDLFTFHELYFMLPVFNAEYRNTVLNHNGWVKEFGGYVEKANKRETPKATSGFTYFLWRVFDLVAFIPQLCFMYVMGHKPNLRRIIEAYRKGRIEFYPSDFKKEKLDLYNQSR